MRLDGIIPGILDLNNFIRVANGEHIGTILSK